MVYAVVIFLQGNRKIEDIRKKYDPRYKNIPAHITLVFPFSEGNISRIKLIDHIQKISKKTNPFSVKTGEIIIASDHALLLVVTKGKKEITKLHDRLYSDFLSEQLNQKFKYIPHITLGLFSNRKEAQKIQRKMVIEKIKFKVKNINLLQLNTNKQFIQTGISKIIWSKDIFLNFPSRSRQSLK
ncbi:MAG: 2'-5' RNA ligase family protein [Nanoarchaeota archaeon]